MMSELIAHYNPKIVELHNYVGTGSVTQKIKNWNVLNGTPLSIKTKSSKNSRSSSPSNKWKDSPTRRQGSLKS